MVELLRHQENVFNDRYKNGDETVEGMWERVAKAAASVEKEPNVWSQRFYEMLKDFKVMPGGRIMAVAGTGQKQPMFNCYVVPRPEDSRKGILDSVAQMADIMAYGGGVGLDLSSLRPKDAVVHGVNGKSSGVIAWANLYSEATGTIIQGGSRRGALLLSLSVDHPDIMDFITAKRNKHILTNANLSVLVSNAFMSAVKEGKSWPLRFNGQIHSNVSARELWDLLCACSWECGEPGIIFIDTYNKMNNTSYFESILTTNPCGELGLPPWGVCPLTSINVSKIKYDDLDVIVRHAVRFLDNMLDVSPYLIPENEKVVKRSRRIGIGTLGWADLFISEKIPYDSEEARGLLEAWYMKIRDTAYDESVKLAQEKGAFPLFDAGAYSERPFIKSLPNDLQERIKLYGIRNASLLTIPPTGSSGILADASSGIEPIFAWVERRKDRLGEYTIEHPHLRDFLSMEDQEEFIAHPPVWAKTAHEVAPVDHVRMQSVAQKYVDSSISKTINLPHDATVEEVKMAFMMAYVNKCKGITAYRDGSREDQVLSKDKKVDAPVEQGLERGVWKRKAEDTTYHPMKIHTGCGKLMFMIGWSEKEQSIQDFYVVRSGEGGCERLLQATTIAISGIIRYGGTVDSVAKGFAGIGTCPSFVRKRGQGGKVSPGTNCASAIINAIKEFLSSKGEPVAVTVKQTVSVPAPQGEPMHACPDCGQEMMRHGGCWSCHHCGYQKCD